MTTKELQENIELILPLRDIVVNQPHGANYLNYYSQWGFKGHNGIDFEACEGCLTYAMAGGKVLDAGQDKDGGIYITILHTSLNKRFFFKTTYYHLSRTIVTKGQEVSLKQEIGYTGNTGKYTSGPHLHLSLKICDQHGNTLDYNNGYGGSIDFSGFLPYNWNKSRAYHRYGRPRTWEAEYWFRFAPANIKNRWTAAGKYVHETKVKMGFTNPALSGEEVNAIIYGGWDLASILNPAMAQNWKWLKKEEFTNNSRTPFLDN